MSLSVQFCFAVKLGNEEYMKDLRETKFLPYSPFLLPPPSVVAAHPPPHRPLPHDYHHRRTSSLLVAHSPHLFFSVLWVKRLGERCHVSHQSRVLASSHGHVAHGSDRAARGRTAAFSCDRRYMERNMLSWLSDLLISQFGPGPPGSSLARRPSFSMISVPQNFLEAIAISWFQKPINGLVLVSNHIIMENVIKPKENRYVFDVS